MSDRKYTTNDIDDILDEYSPKRQDLKPKLMTILDLDDFLSKPLSASSVRTQLVNPASEKAKIEEKTQTIPVPKNVDTYAETPSPAKQQNKPSVKVEVSKKSPFSEADIKPISAVPNQQSATSFAEELRAIRKVSETAPVKIEEQSGNEPQHTSKDEIYKHVKLPESTPKSLVDENDKPKKKLTGNTELIDGLMKCEKNVQPKRTYPASFTKSIQTSTLISQIKFS